MRTASGRTRSIHEAANASAWGARSTMARRPSSGRGNLAILENGFTIQEFLEHAHSKIHCFAAVLNFSRAFFAARFRVHAHHRLGPRQPVANPRAVAEHQLQSVGADDLARPCPQNSRGSDRNFSVNFAFTSGVKRKFSPFADKRNQLGYTAPSTVRPATCLGAPPPRSTASPASTPSFSGT